MTTTTTTPMTDIEVGDTIIKNDGKFTVSETYWTPTATGRIWIVAKGYWIRTSAICGPGVVEGYTNDTVEVAA